MRIKKQDHTNNTATWYVYDASGNLMAVYDNHTGGTLQLKEQPVYASGRVGIYFKQANNYQYELTDHLGNVRAVINRNKLTNGLADVVYYADYYSYGEVLRSGGAGDWRYGYQGAFAEEDGETEWNHFKLRDYDPSIARWFTTDPYGQYASPYLGMGNNPVIGVDPDGGFKTKFGAFLHRTLFGCGAASGIYLSGDEYVYNQSYANGLTTYSNGGRSGDFILGFGNGVVEGGRNIKDFIFSLGTSDGWLSIAEGIENSGKMINPLNAEGAIMKMDIGMSTINYVEHIPNMSAYELGYDLGYGSEKAAEIAITRRVMPVSKSAYGMRTLGNASRYTTIQSINTYGKWGKFSNRMWTLPYGAKTIDKATFYNRNLVIPGGRLIGLGQLQYIQGND